MKDYVETLNLISMKIKCFDFCVGKTFLYAKKIAFDRDMRQERGNEHSRKFKVNVGENKGEAQLMSGRDD